MRTIAMPALTALAITAIAAGNMEALHAVLPLVGFLLGSIVAERKDGKP